MVQHSSLHTSGSIQPHDNITLPSDTSSLTDLDQEEVNRESLPRPSVFTDPLPPNPTPSASSESPILRTQSSSEMATAPTTHNVSGLAADSTSHDANNLDYNGPSASVRYNIRTTRSTEQSGGDVDSPVGRSVSGLDLGLTLRSSSELRKPRSAWYRTRRYIQWADLCTRTIAHQG